MAAKSQRLRIAGVLAGLALTLSFAGASETAVAASHHTKAQVHHKAKVHHKARHKAKAKARASRPAERVTASVAPVASTSGAPAPLTAPTSCADGDLVPTAANLDRVRAATYCLINLERGSHGVPPLRQSPDLESAAQRHSEDMVARNYFDHVGPTGVGLLDRVLAAGYSTVGAVLDLGENISAGGDYLATPAATVAGWMSSPEHRDNILGSSFGDTGIGVVAALPASLGLGQTGATYTQLFGRTG
jgi:uncharacterized protein YkwD